MTLEKANELLAVQAFMGGGYNHNGVQLILTEVQREHGKDAIDSLTSTLELERISGFKPGTEFKN